MNIKPQKGMQEYLPEAAAQRYRLMNLILETYTASGFTRIYTPAIESAENLDKSDGGDNLNLIFRIMKRGDKLAEALAKNPVGGEAPSAQQEAAEALVSLGYQKAEAVSAVHSVAALADTAEELILLALKRLDVR